MIVCFLPDIFHPLTVQSSEFPEVSCATEATRKREFKKKQAFSECL